MERDRLYRVSAAVALATGVYLGAVTHSDHCNKLDWKQENFHYVASPPIKILRENGKYIGSKSLPNGNITFCYKDDGSLITTKDGREWWVEGLVSSMIITKDWEAIGYWTDPTPRIHNYWEDDAETAIFKKGVFFAKVDTRSAYEITSVGNNVINYYATRRGYSANKRLFVDTGEVETLYETWYSSGY